MADEPPFICPGGPADLLGPGIARCRFCGWVFATVMDEPKLPAHKVDGEWVTFGRDLG